MATNRNFIVKQGIQVGTNLTVNGAITSNSFLSNKSDVVAAPSLVLDFGKGKIDSRLQCSRSTNATYVAANGKIVEVGPNIPRVEWDVTTGICRGLVCEEARTNYFAYSDIEGDVGSLPRGMSLASYPDQTAVISTDVWIGPNKMSCKHTRGTGSDSNVGYYIMNIGTLTVNAMYAWSCYVYIPSTTTITYCGITAESAVTTIDSVSGGGAGTADLTIRDRWQRLQLTARVASSTGQMASVLRVEPAGAIVYSDCWQAEQGEYCSTWIPTVNTTTKFRQTEYTYLYPLPSVMGFNDTGFSVLVEASPKWTGNSLMSTVLTTVTSALNPNRGCVSFDVNAAESGSGGPYNGYGIMCQPGSATNGLAFLSRGLVSQPNGFQTSTTSSLGNYVQTAGYNYNTWVANTIVKVGVAVDTTRSRVCVGGDANTIANNTYTGSLYQSSVVVDELRIGVQNQGGSGPIFGGNVRKLSFFPRALSNNELVALTET